MKRILSFFLIMVLIFLLLPAAAASSPATLDIANGSIEITDAGYEQNGQTVAHAGGYVITGSSTECTVSVASGAHDITLRGLSIELPETVVSARPEQEDHCAFALAAGCKVALTLEGDNTLNSSVGHAGIYVPADAALAIGGSGSLYARGGDGSANATSGYQFNGGAGIGGHGYIGFESIGLIDIAGGNVTAVGGATTTKHTSYCAGAGIGSGGGTNNGSTSPKGEIVIRGGVVDAAGGTSRNSGESGGGAGIGAGGYNDSAFSSLITISITAGEITARGGPDAAGIGAGSNTHQQGEILIEGGVVNAYGGQEDTATTWGGAGIGAGDNGCVSNIKIGGDAVVFAQGGGAASGIGAGNFAGVWDFEADAPGNIHIYGNAVVMAYGGAFESAATGNKYGGAGIGAGRKPTHAMPSVAGFITIDDAASVTAYAGWASQAVGTGHGYVHDETTAADNVLTINTTGKLQFFNCCPAKAAHLPNVTGSAAPKLVCFTLKDSGASDFPQEDAEIETTSADDYVWKYTGDAGAFSLDIDLGNDSHTLASSGEAFGNWAVLGVEPPQRVSYTVTFNSNGGSAVAQQILTVDEKIEKPADPVRSGYVFAGWYKDAALIELWDFDSAPNAELTLYAKWQTAPKTPSTGAGGGGLNPSAKLPQTGDSGMAIGFGALAFLSLVVISLAVKEKKKYKSNL